MYFTYFFPLGTETRLRRVPAVSLGLAGTLVLVHYLLNFYRPTVHLYDVLVLSTAHPTLLQAFTACFVHGGLLHLGGNLLYLLTFGPALEDRIGRGPMMGFYLLAGLVSMLVQVEVLRRSGTGGDTAVLGASGAISGLLGLFLARCGFLRVRVAHATFAYLQAQARGGVVALPAWVAVLLWALLQGIYALVTLGNPASGTAYWAHLSGLGFGLGVGLLGGQAARAGVERRVVRGQRYLERGEWFAALGEFQSCGGDPPPGALLGQARSYRLLGRRAEALAAYRAGIGRLVEEESWEEVAAADEEAARVDPVAVPDPAAALAAAEALEERGDLSRAADLYQRAGSAHPDPAAGAESLSRAAEIARLHLGDLERASGLFEAAAERLAGSLGGAHPQADRLRHRGRECRTVLAHRLRTANSTA